jgi:hypothetical protein
MGVTDGPGPQNRRIAGNDIDWTNQLLTPPRLASILPNCARRPLGSGMGECVPGRHDDGRRRTGRLSVGPCTIPVRRNRNGRPRARSPVRPATLRRRLRPRGPAAGAALCTGMGCRDRVMKAADDVRPIGHGRPSKAGAADLSARRASGSSRPRRLAERRNPRPSHPVGILRQEKSRRPDGGRNPLFPQTEPRPCLATLPKPLEPGRGPDRFVGHRTVAYALRCPPATRREPLGLRADVTGRLRCRRLDGGPP